MLQMKYARPMSLAAATLLVGACATTTDPGKAGFLDGLANQTTGTYKRNIASKQQERSGIERANELLGKDVNALEDREASNRGNLLQARNRLADLHAEIADLKEKYRVDEQAHQKELAVLRDVEQQLEQQDVLLRDPPTKQSAERSAETLERLAKIVKALPK